MNKFITVSLNFNVNLRFNELGIKTLILLSLLLINNGISTFANDGWSNAYSNNSGELFSPIEHPSISLKKEVLILKDMNTWEVNYQFYNDSNQDIEVPVLFPISTSFPARNDIDTIYFTSSFGDWSGNYPFLLNDFLNPLCRFALPNYEYEDESNYMYIDSNIFKQPYRHTINIENTYNEILQNIEKFKNDTSIDSKLPKYIAMKETYDKYYKSFSVVQDGKQVRIDSLLFESKIQSNGLTNTNKYVNSKTSDKNFVFTMHYPHKLYFKANQLSNVSISYTVSTVTDGGIEAMGRGVRARYQPSYFIGPGKTWKGTIEDFYFVYPKSFLRDSVFYQERNKLESDNIFCWNNYKMNILHAHNYEPVKDEEINLTYLEHNDFRLNDPENPFDNKLSFFDGNLDSMIYVPVTDNLIKSYFKYNGTPIKNIKASYNNKGNQKICFSKESYDDSISESKSYLIAKSNNIIETKTSSEALFDGLVESPCLLGKKLTKDYTVDFDVTEDSYGIQIYNGFWGYNLAKINYQSDYNDNEIINSPTEFYHTNFNNYARAKSLALENLSTGSKVKINLSDSTMNYSNYFVRKGKYRISLLDYYPGTIPTNPVCISEILFLPFNIDPYILADDFFRKVFQESFKIKIEK